MPTQIPLVRARNLFSYQLRYGLVTWGYVRLIFFLIDLCEKIVSMKDIIQKGNHEYEILIRSFIVTKLKLDLISVIILIIGTHMKSVTLMRTYFFYDLFQLILQILLTAALTIFSINAIYLVYQLTYYQAYPSSKAWSSLVFLVLGMHLTLWLPDLLVRAYVLILVKSEIMKLMTNHEHEVANNANEASENVAEEEGIENNEEPEDTRGLIFPVWLTELLLTSYRLMLDINLLMGNGLFVVATQRNNADERRSTTQNAAEEEEIQHSEEPEDTGEQTETPHLNVSEESEGTGEQTGTPHPNISEEPEGTGDQTETRHPNISEKPEVTGEKTETPHLIVIEESEDTGEQTGTPHPNISEEPEDTGDQTETRHPNISEKPEVAGEKTETPHLNVSEESEDTAEQTETPHPNIIEEPEDTGNQTETPHPNKNPRD